MSLRFPLLNLIAQCATVDCYVKQKANLILVTNTIIAHLYYIALMQISQWGIIDKFNGEFT